MAKKKPAARMQAKKTAKPAVKKLAKKAAKPMTKKAAPKKAAKTAKKPAGKPAKKGLLGKVFSKAKQLTKEQLKALAAKEKAAAAKEKARLAKEAAKEKAREQKEAAREKAMAAKEAAKEKARQQKEKEKEKALAAKEKERQAKDKAREKEDAKKAKEAEKARIKAEKEAEKARIKAEKEAAKRKKLGLDDEEGEEGGMVARRRGDEDEDEDEFLEYSKKGKKTGRKAYEDEGEVQVDLFSGGAKRGKKYDLSDLEGKISDEITSLREHLNWKEIAEAIGTMDFFIDAKNDECIEKGCDNIRTTQSYCRLHYLRNWKTIQKKRDILKEGKLQEYIEELISKYPPKYIEALLSDLSDDKEFYRVLNELNITSEFDFEEDDFENAADDDDDGDDIGIETISTSLRYEDE